jgi:hypothetical protein
MKIAILYFCVGKYDILWQGFYSSCEKYFCAGHEKHYFVFTDSTKISSGTGITKIHQDNLGWPFISLYRYRIFNKIQNQLEHFDYIVFFNANLQFLQPITLLEFFGDGSKSLVACQHPEFYNKESIYYPFEHRILSTAYTRLSHSYFQGAINGGKSGSFLAMVKELMHRIEQDLDNGITAKWYDESYWNAYVNNLAKNELQVLTPSYLYPEDWVIPFKPVIKQRNKNKINTEASEKNIIVVWCCGGLGNQMFQYAFYRSLQVMGANVKFDISEFKHYAPHNGYEIDKIFSINPDYATDLDKSGLESIVQSDGGYNEKYIRCSGAYFLEGYWQSEKYFLNCIDNIRHDFTFPALDGSNNLIAQQMQDTNSVSIHIRRGDYVDNPLHGGICTIDYYFQAIAIIESVIIEPMFYVFSNDIDWCKDNLKLKNAAYIVGNNGNNSYKDMQLMSLCKHNIIANSSFSWWGAWLNVNSSKIVIAPKKWHNQDGLLKLPKSWVEKWCEGNSINVRDLIPNGWIKLDC